MRPTRAALLAVAAAGALVCAVGSSGVVAAFTDTARTGASGNVEDLDHIDTAAVEAGGADIELASYPRDPACGAFADDVAGPVYQLDGVQAGDTAIGGPFYRGLCVRNAGPDAVAVALGTEDVTSWELTCEPSEAAVDPQGATCGDLGESAAHVRYRSTVVAVVTDPATCPPNPVASGPYLPLTDDQASFDLQPGETACLAIDFAYEPGSAAAALAAQTDRTRFRFLVEATVP